MFLASFNFKLAFEAKVVTTTMEAFSLLFLHYLIAFLCYLFTFLNFSFKPSSQKTKVQHAYKYSQPLLSTSLKHLWQQLQPPMFLSTMLQAFTSAFGQFLPFVFAEPLRLHRVGWGVLVQRCLIEFKSPAAPPKDIHRLVPKLLLCCLGCVLTVIVLLKDS